MTRSTTNFNPVLDPYLHCPCCKKGQLSIATFILLETIREHFSAPVTILSGPRCAKHNKTALSPTKKSGAKNSEHLIREDEDVDAVDIKVKGHTPQEVYLYLKSLPYANLLGIGKYRTFVHVDPRGYAARW